jgi:hypothetical protein
LIQVLNATATQIDTNGCQFMVSENYLVQSSPAPSTVRRFFNQQIVPGAIDTVAYVESGVERIAQGTRRQPVMMLGVAMSAGFLVSLLRARLEARSGM